jgi:hypothetical protein
MVSSISFNPRPGAAADACNQLNDASEWRKTKQS